MALPNGERAFIEVETRSFARLGVNQRVAYPSILSQAGVVIGPRAASLPLSPGFGPTRVWIVWRLP